MKRDIFKRFITSVVSDDIYPNSSNEVQRDLIVNYLYEEYTSNPIKVSQIKNYMNTEFNVTLSTDEVEDCLDGIELVDKKIDVNEISYQISPEHYSQIDSQKKRNLDFYIDLYMSEYCKDVECNIRESIYKFLYLVSNNNLLDFQKIVSNDLHLQPEDEISKEFSTLDISHINNFLNWENPDKNEIIYKLSNIGLEYFILSNTDEFDLLKEIGVEQKHFYLDTNILYRSLGLNGQYRKDRISTFLDKCKETEQQLFITKFTQKEFFDSIKYHCESLDRYKVHHPKLFIEHSMDDDFYYFYYSWKQTHPNSTVSTFMTTIKTSYRQFVDKYDIEVESGNLFNEHTESIKKEISDTALQIYRYKKNKESQHDYILCTPEKNEYDSKNILYIDKKRETEGDQYRTVKTFMVSTDHHLLNWDHSRKNLMPVVLLPSQWLSLMLRFVSRTNNDFESFVSFINIPNKKETVNNEKMNIILSGINEITEDINSQVLILDELMEQRFFNILSSGKKDKIYDRTMRHARRVKDEKLSQLLKEKEQLEIESRKKISEHEKEIDERRTEIQSVSEEASKKDKVIEHFQTKIKIMEEIEELKKTRRPGYLSILSIIILLVPFTLIFIYHNKDWNFMWKLFELIDSEENGFYKDFLLVLFGLGIPVLIGFLTRSVKVRIIDISNKIRILRGKIK